MGRGQLQNSGSARMISSKAIWVKHPPAMIATPPEWMGRMLHPYDSPESVQFMDGLWSHKNSLVICVWYKLRKAKGENRD
jgi:hypothetical protein